MNTSFAKEYDWDRIARESQARMTALAERIAAEERTGQAQRCQPDRWTADRAAGPSRSGRAAARRQRPFRKHKAQAAAVSIPETPECTETPSCSCPPCRQRREDQAAEEAARIALAQRLPRSGSRTPSLGESRNRGAQRSEQHLCPVISSAEEAKAKLKAELDDNPLSRDWDEAPEGAKDTYLYLHSLYLAKEPLDAKIVTGAVREFLTRVRKNGAALIEIVKGQIRLLGDTCEDKPEREKYPGAPEDRNPSLGRALGKEGDDALVALWQAQNGQPASVGTLLRIMNSRPFRQVMGLTVCRYAGREWYKTAIRRVRAAGRLVVVRKAEHYRRMHVWRTVPASYGAPDRSPAPLTVQRVVAAIEEARQRLALAQGTAGAPVH